MESPTLTIQYRWTADLVIRAKQAHFQEICRRPYRIALHVICILMGLSGISLLCANHEIFGQILGTALTISFAIWLIKPFWDRRKIRRYFINHEEDITWKVFPNQVQILTEENKLESEWSFFTKIVLHDDGFLVYVKNNMFYWIPRNSFANNDHMAQFIKCVRANISLVTQKGLKCHRCGYNLSGSIESTCPECGKING